jgi:hypothetical protein
MNLRNDFCGKKKNSSHTVPATTEMNVASAAPETPIGWCVTQPKIRNGASTMLRMTVAVWTSIPGLKLPVPRRAAPIATIANWNAVAGMNQPR